jgi:type I restriction enzyme S subunit
MRVISLLQGLEQLVENLREQNTTLEALAQTLFRSWFVNFDPVYSKVSGQTPDGMSPKLAALFPSELVESELGLIPKGWKYSQLKELADLQNGFAFKSKDWTDDGLPVLKIGNVLPLLATKDRCSFVSEASVEGLQRFRLSEGDILVGMTGYVGTTGLVPSSDRDIYLNQRVGKIFPTVEGSRSFVFCIARSNEFKVHCENNAAGSAQANISGKQILEFGCVIPSDSILKAFDCICTPLIASILSNNSIALKLTEIRDELLPRLISGKLRIDEAEEAVSKVLGSTTEEEKAA